MPQQLVASMLEGPFWFRCDALGHWNGIALRPVGGFGAAYWIDVRPFGDWCRRCVSFLRLFGVVVPMK